MLPQILFSVVILRWIVRKAMARCGPRLTPSVAARRSNPRLGRNSFGIYSQLENRVDTQVACWRLSRRWQRQASLLSRTDSLSLRQILDVSLDGSDFLHVQARNRGKIIRRAKPEAGCLVKMMVSPCLGRLQAQPMEMSSSTPESRDAAPHGMGADCGRRCILELVRYVSGRPRCGPTYR